MSGTQLSSKLKCETITCAELTTFFDFREPSGLPFPSPQLERTPWALIHQPRCSQTQSQHQDWVHRPCIAWPWWNVTLCSTYPSQAKTMLTPFATGFQDSFVICTAPLSIPLLAYWLEYIHRLQRKWHTVQNLQSASCECTTAQWAQWWSHDRPLEAFRPLPPP